VNSKSRINSLLLLLAARAFAEAAANVYWPSFVR